MTEVFECEIQARFRDVNVGGHIDNVEAIRVLDEARVRFFALSPAGSPRMSPGLLQCVPYPVVALVAGQRVDYHAEMRFAAWQPFLVRLWATHVGRTSFTISSELRVAAGHPPALVAETSLVMWDPHASKPWPITTELRSALERFRNEPVELRERRT